MKRIFNIVILLLALSPALVNAFGLGNLDLNSALNEPFDARIQLLSPTADELDSLKVNLADSEAFTRAKVDRPFILSKLKFELRRSVDDGPDYIRVYSQDSIREPFLNFLVEVSWSNGRLFREYTVLLDPPLYDPNARANEFKQSAKSSSSSTVTPIAKTDSNVVYGDAFEKFSNSGATSPTYSPASNVNYSSGDYGPTTSSDTLWSIASNMRPDNSISVNQMMLALLKANPDAFINQNINGLKKGQILRAPNESEMRALSNAEALSEAKSQYSAWGDIRENLSNVVSERPEVSSVPETPSAAVEETVSEEAAADAELKLVSADDSAEATEQVSSVDSGSGEELVLAQETIQVLTQENIELKDRVQESEALLADLKRLLSLKDDELAALQEQMATTDAQQAIDETAVEAMGEAEDVIAGTEDDATVEEEVISESDENVVDEAEEAITEDEQNVNADDEEEIIAVVETEPESDSAGIMGMVNQYLAPVKDLVMGNPIVGMALAGLLVLILIIVVVMKFRKEPAETVQIDAMTEEAFPDFDSGDLGDTGEDLPDSEAVTVLPDADAQAEESADFDLDIDEEDAKTQFVAAEEVPAPEEAPAPVEEEEEEDPLQEVNTYLAFEQFDQAEEFVRNVISNDPENPEYHTKLLEVFYTSGNKKSYEEEAKVLHGIVGGEGEHWNIATAMWQEMSPNRALFEEGDADEEETTDSGSAGFVDVTADDEAGDSGSDLDFDIGGADTSDDDGMLDVTGAGDVEDLLDVTAAVSMDEVDSEAETATSASSDEILDISGTGGSDLLDLTSGEESSSEDLLDVTTATNLDLDSEEDLLDVTAATSAGADSSALLDLEDEPDGEAVDSESNEIEFDLPAETDETVEFDLGSAEETSSSEENDENVLDFDMSSEEDNEIELDASEPETDASDDIGLDMDLGSVDDETSSEENDENVLDFDMSSAEDNEIELDASGPETDASDDIGLDMDLGSVDDETSSEESDENVLDFDMSSAEDDEIELDASEPETDESKEDENELDFAIGSAEEDEEEAPIRLDVDEAEESDDISLDMDLGVEESAEDDISLDLDMSDDDDGIELDLSIGEDEPVVKAESAASDDESEVDFNFSIDEDEPEEESIDLDGTVELPKSALSSMQDDDDDDDDDHTVFVPRSSQPEEQSADDEIATKLDLAKAYVELGDQDSAKAILDEVMIEGNDEQRMQAEDLLGQI